METVVIIQMKLIPRKIASCFKLLSLATSTTSPGEGLVSFPSAHYARPGLLWGFPSPKPKQLSPHFTHHIICGGERGHQGQSISNDGGNPLHQELS